MRRRRLEYWPDSELPDIMNFFPQHSAADDMYARGFGSLLGPGPADPSSVDGFNSDRIRRGTGAGSSSVDPNLVLASAYRQGMDMGDPSQQGHYFEDSQGERHNEWMATSIMHHD